MTGCSHLGCVSTFANHRWGKQKAQNEGWFLQRNGANWCPKHLPEWLQAWRAREEENEKKYIRSEKQTETVRYDAGSASDGQLGS